MNIIGVDLEELGSNYSDENIQKYVHFIKDMMTVHPFPTDEELKELIESVHKLGGLVSVNHVIYLILFINLSDPVGN